MLFGNAINLFFALALFQRSLSGYLMSNRGIGINGDNRYSGINERMRLAMLKK